MMKEEGLERRFWEELNTVERNEFNYMEPVGLTVIASCWLTGRPYDLVIDSFIVLFVVKSVRAW